MPNLSRVESKNATTSELRNTNADWEIIGEQEPYWGVRTETRFRTENLTEKDIADFFESGNHNIDLILQRMRALFGPFAPKSALDFGCGVGRLTRPLAELTGEAVGVDISPGMLAEARKYEGKGASFVDEFPERRFDWVVSLIVLQHITPEFGHEAIRKLLKAVAPHGGITLQITFSRTVASGGPGSRLIIDGDNVRTSDRGADTLAVPPGVMIMHDYDLGRVVTQFFVEGFEQVHLEKTDHGGVIGAVIYARRGS